MPPKMRKKWMHRELEAMKESNVKMAMAASGSELGNGNSGLGIRLGSAGGTHHQLYLVCWVLIRPLDDELMPPPPMPASLDPTTITSTHPRAKSSLASPNPVQTSPLPPSQGPPASPSSLSPAAHSASFSNTSPLNSFANLSLLSPAIISHSRNHINASDASTAGPQYPLLSTLPPTHGYKLEDDVREDVIEDEAEGWSPLKRAENVSISPLEATPQTSVAMEVDIAPSPFIEQLQRTNEPPVLVDTQTEAGDNSENQAAMDDDRNIEMRAAEHLDESWRSPSRTQDLDPDSVSSTPPMRSASPIAISNRRPHSQELDPHDVVDYTPQSSEPSTPSPRSTSPPPIAETPPPTTGTSATPTVSIQLSASTVLSPVAEDRHKTMSPLSRKISPVPLATDDVEEHITIIVDSISPTFPSSPDHSDDDRHQTTAEHITDARATAISHLEPNLSPQPLRALSPAAPPKVKMSLRDFALRKKKQREEMELSMSMQASPMSTTSALGEVDVSEEGETEKDITGTALDAHVRVREMVATSEGAGEEVAVRPLEDVEDEVDPVQATSYRTPDPPTLDLSAELLSVKPTLNDHIGDPSLPAPNAPTPPPATVIPVTNPNGHAQPSAPAPVTTSLSLPPQPPPLLPPRPQPTSNHFNAYPRKAKQELIEHFIPNRVASPTPPPSLLQRVSGFDRSISPISPDPAFSFASRVAQEEDGEIDEASHPPLRYTLPHKRDFNFQPRPASISPQSQVLPTGPRSFNPNRSSTMPPRQSGNRPPPPSAPRALRQSLLSNRPTGGLSQSHSPPHPTSNGHGGSSYIPRGPSADRDRDRDRERERSDWDPQRQYRGPTRRGGGHGWGR